MGKVDRGEEDGLNELLSAMGGWVGGLTCVDYDCLEEVLVS